MLAPRSAAARRRASAWNYGPADAGAHGL